jgi:Ni/Co efflux regulator RcnB
VFFAQDYWIYDFGDYGLPYPPPGAVWVRYGPDALLIDRYTGEIIEVIYGLFY